MSGSIVVMGVTGTGKSTVAAGLAQALGLRCIDGDDLHAPDAVERMRAGIALTDADRWPWLARVGEALAAGPVVASCSALKRAYRDRLRAACPGLRFVFLDGDAALVAGRLEQRRGHYMPGTLLASQLDTLERPGADEPDVARIDIAAPPADVIAAAVGALRGSE